MIKSIKNWSFFRRDAEKFNIALDQCEEEYEREILKKKEEFNEFMKALTRETEELKDTRDEYKREIDKLEKKIESCERKGIDWLGNIVGKQYQLEKLRLSSENKDKDEEYLNVKDQLSEKQSSIKDKEKNIKELKNYIEHLENFKFVLDHKIKTLKDEKSPMEEQVKILEQHIRNMYNELAEETAKNKNLEQKLKSSKSRNSWFTFSPVLSDAEGDEE
jgi:cilia- and flagella-associated protein 57